MPNKVQFKLTKLQRERTHLLPTPISSSQAKLFSSGRGRELDLRGSLCFFGYFIKIRQSRSLPRPCRYLPPRACLDSPSTLNWLMEGTIPTSVCRIGSILAVASGKGVNWRNWKMPKMKAKDNAEVPIVSLPSTSQDFPLRGQSLPFLLSPKSDHSSSLLLNISLKNPPSCLSTLSLWHCCFIPDIVSQIRLRARGWDHFPSFSQVFLNLLIAQGHPLAAKALGKL